MKALRFIEKSNWERIFAAWEEREGTMEEWRQVAKQKGWESWRVWRSEWAKNIGAASRIWQRYAILDPLAAVPQFRVGPTQSWQKRIPSQERLKRTFAKFVSQASFKGSQKVKELLANFPEPTEFIGVLLPDGSIVLIEGHHRATALAIAAKEKRNMAFHELPTIALTRFEAGEEKLLFSMLERGSVKQAYL